MITIKFVPVSKNESDRRDFHKSIAANAAVKNSHEVICLADTPNQSSRITIYLPDNCLVIGPSWDRYILYALDNGLPKGDPDRTDTWMTWPQYVRNKLNLIDRTHSGIFPDLRVELPVATL